MPFSIVASGDNPKKGCPMSELGEDVRGPTRRSSSHMNTQREGRRRDERKEREGKR